MYACPAYKKDSKCPKNDKCRLPHRDAAFFEDKVKDNGDDPTDEEDNWRYFEKNDIQMSENDDGCTIIPNRDNFGKMGDFIPL